MTILDDTQLITIHGGQAIPFNNAEEAIRRTRERAQVCRQLHEETQRETGGREPVPGTDGYALAAATRACWASIGGGNNRR